ncbi:MAG: hypothetical protein JXB00_11935 [Bacteroidales bacterium]|nr:hypothetical protein [Bacteroidales bacterium]
MANRVLCIAFFLVAVIIKSSTAQHYIGRHKDEIVKLMSLEFKNFKQNKDVVNNAYKYLKYEDRISEQTMLFFLSEDDHCTLVRWISDYANINDVTAMLDKKYTAEGKNIWAYDENGKKYTITLKKEEWFFTVTFRLKN